MRGVVGGGGVFFFFFVGGGGVLRGGGGRDRLAAEGAVFGTSTVQRFLKRYGLERERRLGRRVANLRRKRAAARRG
ncbi:MAG: hypothetical protein F4Y03_05330 [Alphaproteobacteria bacterium]|nr:hypothetical protein [Alphaproteobacteria bacterium]